MTTLIAGIITQACWQLARRGSDKRVGPLILDRLVRAVTDDMVARRGAEPCIHGQRSDDRSLQDPVEKIAPPQLAARDQRNGSDPWRLYRQHVGTARTRGARCVRGASR